MKKIIALLLTTLMVLTLAACGGDNVGDKLVHTFEENADKTPQEIADAMIENPVIEFMGMTAPVEEGYLSGFGDTEITGFDEGVMFGPAIGTIPFVGYVFDLSDDTDVDEFVQTIEDNADLRWNICTEADELVVENKGDKVVVIMTPESFESEEDADGNVGEDEVPIAGDDFADPFE